MQFYVCIALIAISSSSTAFAVVTSDMAPVGSQKFGSKARAGDVCLKDGLDWRSAENQVGEVVGDARLYLHPDYPGNCSGGNQSCLAKSFVLKGDRVIVGGKCGRWANVQYIGEQSTSWGWVESARLKLLGTVEKISARPLDTPRIPLPAVCNAARDRLNAELEADYDGFEERKLVSFPQVQLNFKVPVDLPEAVKAEDEVVECHYCSMAEATIDGLPAKVISYGDGGMCESKRLMVWNAGLSKMFYPVNTGKDYANFWSDPFTVDSMGSTEALVSYQGKAYVEWHSLHDRTVRLFGFKKDHMPELTCELTQVARQPELIEKASERHLCEAISVGRATALSKETMDDSKELDLKASGSDITQPDPVADWHYYLTAKSTADLYNDGHPIKVGYVSGVGQMGVGCGDSLRQEWLSPLNEKGDLDKAAAGIDVGAEDLSLLSYEGSVYVDARSDESSNSPRHEIWKVSQKGIAKMCSYVTVRYEVQE